MSVLHRLLDCMYAVYSSRFDPRAQDWRSGLYISAPATALRHKSFEKIETLIILRAPPYSIHMHILIWLYDLTLFGSEVWFYNISITSMLSSCNYHSYELHISISYRRRKCITSFIDLVRIHKYHIYERLESVIQRNLWAFILKTYKTLEQW